MIATASRIVGLALWLVLSAPRAAFAQPRELRYNIGVDSAITVSAAGLWIASELLRPKIAPRACRWCESNGVDGTVRSVTRWNAPDAADKASNVTAFIATPLTALGADTLAAAHQGAVARAPLDALFVAEATVLALDVCTAIKLIVARERPFVHALAPDRKSTTPDPSDNNLSFVSGHTTETFAVAAAAGTVASLRRYEWAPLVWVAGLGGATTTGYLRIAADKHWLTDVLGGTVLGIGVGAGAVALLHHPSATSAASSSSASTVATPLTIAFAW
ncbi:MAG TPA: phosphatase PAP2 family protein [Polyangiaceae bacterium]|nr:phosphatase PAP2 family protein [Polyangiaceae bacterium]